MGSTLFSHTQLLPFMSNLIYFRILTGDGDVTAGRVVDVPSLQRVGNDGGLVQLNVEEVVNKCPVLQIQQDGCVLANGHPLDNEGQGISQERGSEKAERRS